jgi:hypothetical protein
MTISGINRLAALLVVLLLLIVGLCLVSILHLKFSFGLVFSFRFKYSTQASASDLALYTTHCMNFTEYTRGATVRRGFAVCFVGSEEGREGGEKRSK